MLMRSNQAITKGGTFIERTQCPTLDHFIGFTNSNGALERIYNDGLTACYVNRTTRFLYSYCEGDVTIYDCPTRQQLAKQIYAHAQYFINA